MRLLLLLAAGVLALPTRGAEPVAAPDPAKPYSAAKSAPVAYDIDFRAVVTPPSGTKTLKVWVPVAQDDAGQKVTEGEWSVFPSDVKPTFHTEKVFGNRFAYFEFAAPQGARRYMVAFTPTDPVLASSSILALPIGTHEEPTGHVNGEPIAITPVWVRLGTAPVPTGSLESTLIVIFE